MKYFLIYPPCTHPHQHELRDVHFEENIVEEVLNYRLNHKLAVESKSCRDLVRIPPAGVDVAGAVGHVHLVAGVQARVLLLLPAPDAAREVLHQGRVLGAQLRAANGAPVDAGFGVETSPTSFQVEQDTLARVGGVVRQVVADGREGIDSYFLRKVCTLHAQIFFAKQGGTAEN